MVSRCVWPKRIASGGRQADYLFACIARERLDTGVGRVLGRRLRVPIVIVLVLFCFRCCSSYCSYRMHCHLPSVGQRSSMAGRNIVAFILRKPKSGTTTYEQFSCETTEVIQNCNCFLFTPSFVVIVFPQCGHWKRMVLASLHTIQRGRCQGI